MGFKEDIVYYGKELINNKLTNSTSGNLSIRCGNQIAISPSGIDYLKTTVDDVVIVDIDGNKLQGDKKPSSEIDFHLSLYKYRDDINAIIHTHSIYATTIACLNKEIPPIHYMIAVSGNKVPIAPYATFGTKELSKSIVDNIKNYNAILLQNHGLVCVGKNIESAFKTVLEIEYVANIYYKTLCVGNGSIIDENEMKKVVKKFTNYGQKS